MKTSPAGIAFIKNREGCRLHAYKDIVGVWTIGYGDTLDVFPGMQISQQEAEDRLHRRLTHEFEPAVNRIAAEAPTTQLQFDAMVSLAWNIGTHAFEHNSSVARYHRDGQYMLAADAFLLYNKAGGRRIPALARRREEERKNYLSGTPLDETVASVLDVQRRLVELGYPIKLDGIIGPKTCDAILDALTDENES